MVLMAGLKIMEENFWNGKKVFLTGHTGFKGGWLSIWLAKMGAEVIGFSLDPPTEPSFYKSSRLKKYLHNDLRGDIRNRSALNEALLVTAPEIVFHLAAQPLVRKSYIDPVETYETNVMGTVNLLECVRKSSTIKAVVIVTTDKCYENREWLWPYREDDTLGGHDPYSSSKGCAELITSAYRNSFLNKASIQIASARAGNVIGGGDWASERLIPDFLRAIQTEQTLNVRNPTATRPWQHVLEPLAGYICLAKALYEKIGYNEAWNFGPNETDTKSVDWIIQKLSNLKPNIKWHYENKEQLHEANILTLSSAKAKARLDWHPRWKLEHALTKTIEWHDAWIKGDDLQDVTERQISEYENAQIDG